MTWSLLELLMTYMGLGGPVSSWHLLRSLDGIGDHGWERPSYAELTETTATA